MALPNDIMMVEMYRRALKDIRHVHAARISPCFLHIGYPGVISGWPQNNNSSNRGRVVNKVVRTCDPAPSLYLIWQWNMFKLIITVP